MPPLRGSRSAVSAVGGPPAVAYPGASPGLRQAAPRTVDAPPESSWDAFGRRRYRRGRARAGRRRTPRRRAVLRVHGVVANPPSGGGPARREFDVPRRERAVQDAVTARPSRTLIRTGLEGRRPRTRKRTSRIGGVSDRPLVVAVAPSRSGTSQRRARRRGWPPPAGRSPPSGVPTGASSSAGVTCASPAGLLKRRPGAGPRPGERDPRRPRCLRACGGHRGAARSSAATCVVPPPQRHRALARADRQESDRARGSAAPAGHPCQALHLRGSRRHLRGGDDAETSATPSAPLWWPTATSLAAPMAPRGRACRPTAPGLGPDAGVCCRRRAAAPPPPPPPPPAVPNRQTRHFPPRSPETQRSGATGDTDNALTSAVCPRIVRRHRREVVSHRRRLVSAEPETSRCVTPGRFAKHSAVTRLTCPTSDPTNRRHARVSSGRTRTTALRAAYAYRVPYAPPQSPSADPYQFGAGGIAIDASRPVASIAADPRARVPPRLSCVADFPQTSTTSVDAGKKRLLGSGGGGAPGVPGRPGANGFEGLDGDDQARVSID